MTTTTYLELDDQATGANNNTWGDVADANMAILEQAIARYVAISTTGGTTTLTSAQNRYPILRITGVLASNATIVVRTAEKNWTVINATTGNFSVTVKTLSGTGKTVPRGRGVFLYCDGTNVERVRHPGIAAAQAGGTVDAITATFEPATVSGELQDGTMFIVEAAGANTSTTPTFNPDSTGALTITKNGGQALVAGDIRAAGHKLVLVYDASSTRYELLNPYLIPVAQVSGLGALATLATVGTSQIDDSAVTTAKIAANAVDGTKIALGSDAQGDVMYYDGTNYVRLGAGTSGHYLKTNGTGANPAWAAVSASGTDILGTISTASGTSASLGSLDLTSYKVIELWFQGVSHSSASNLSYLVGNSTSDDVAVSTGTLDTAGLDGFVFINLADGKGCSALGHGASSGGTDRSTSFDTALSTATTTISVALSGGGNLDAGSILVVGRK